MQQKIIIAFIVLFFIISSAYLFSVSDRKQDLNLNKNWWAVYFENPTDNSLDFTIENYTSNDDFSWQILSKKNVIASGQEKIPSGETKKIEASIEASTKKGLITVHITTSQESKDIYKNIN